MHWSCLQFHFLLNSWICRWHTMHLNFIYVFSRVFGDVALLRMCLYMLAILFLVSSIAAFTYCLFSNKEFINIMLFFEGESTMWESKGNSDGWKQCTGMLVYDFMVATFKQSKFSLSLYLCLFLCMCVCLFVLSSISELGIFSFGVIDKIYYKSIWDISTSVFFFFFALMNFCFHEPCSKFLELLNFIV